MRLTVDGRLGPEESFDLPPGEDVPAVFPFQFTTPGRSSGRSSIDDDPLALDNRRYMVVPVRESLNVLLVDGHFKSEPTRPRPIIWRRRSRPTEESPGQPRPIRVEVVPESQLSHRELAELRRRGPVQRRPVHTAGGDGSRRLPEAGRRGGLLRRRSGRAPTTTIGCSLPRARALAGQTRPEHGGRVQEGREASSSILSVIGIRSSPNTRARPTRSRPASPRRCTWQYHKLVLPQGHEGRGRAWRSTTAIRP